MIRFRFRPARATLVTGLLCSSLAPFLLPSVAVAQHSPTLRWHGELRPRMYAQEPVHGEWDHWISMRSRLGLDARFDGGMRLFLQVQDVRYWGEELTNRDKTADAVDFHQAFLEVDSLPGLGGLIRAGRQEVTIAESRFIGAPDWGDAGQTFDGLLWTRPMGAAHLDVVYIRLREGSSPVHDHSADMTAAWLALPSGELGSLDFLGFHDRSGDPDRTSQNTLGSVWKKGFGDLSFRVQGMVQFGERAGVDVSAHMVAARGTLGILDGDGTVTLWYDYLSGDSDPTDNETGAFSTLFGARHRYYGTADFFLDIPQDTGGLGLQDAAVKLAFTPTPTLSVNVDFHTFLTAQEGDLSSRHLAEEADLWIRHQFRGALALEVGSSLTWAGTAMEELGRLEGTATALYVMTSLKF
jgi:hypothetical protein